MSDQIFIRDVMSHHILECAPSKTIQDVARLMSQKKCSSIIIIDHDQAVGIWTEKDALKLDFNDPACVNKSISEVMSFPVKTISQDATLEEAAVHLKEEGIRHYLVIDEDERRQGIISQTDIVSQQEMERFLYMSKVSSIVTHAPAISTKSPLSEASQLMMRYRLEALAVYSSSGNLGIISERDLVRALSCSPIPEKVGAISTPEMLSVRESDSIFHARNLMVDRGFRHLGVKNHAEQYIGIISFSSILESIRENSFKIMQQVMEKKLHLRTAEFGAIFHSMADCVLFLDTHQQIKTVNTAFESLFGYRSEEVLGREGTLLYADKMDDSVQNRFNLSTKENLKPYEMNYRRKDGSEFIGESVGSVFKDGKGTLLGFSIIIRDVSKRKQEEDRRLRLEMRLRQNQKLESIGTLAGGIAHEINNPVTGIMNYAQLIQDRIEPESPLREFAVQITRETERVAEIVRNLLAFARQEKESHSPAKMGDILDNTLSLIRTIIRRDQIDLQVDIAEDLPLLKCRSQQIQQILMNLLTNARDALNARYPGHDPDKCMRVSAETFTHEERRWVRVTVEDHGIGIPYEIRSRMFDPFFTTKDRSHGTGLGLSISHGITEDHHGKLYFECELTQYTRFHLELPVDNGWQVDRNRRKEDL